LQRAPDAVPCPAQSLARYRALHQGRPVTNTVALIIGIVLLMGMATDYFANDGAALYFLTRKFLDLVEWVSFWR
jgi:hypothetical protein